MKIGLFGGSFNPVHYGHVNIARTAIAELGLDRLIVIPASVSPFKTEIDRTVPALDRAREIEQLKAAFSAVEKAEVDERELRRGGVSYSIDTVREIAAENPGAELVFLIGEDSVAGLPRWKEIDELRRLCSFRSYPRTRESSTEIRELFRAAGVTLNPEGTFAAMVWQGVLKKHGFCPCRLAATPENFCPCAEFRGQLRDPAFHGCCHCRLYLKPERT